MADIQLIKISIIYLLYLFYFGHLYAQPTIPCGHSHNDYLQKKPLFKALELGYGSIEIDLCLDDQNQLKVSHNPVSLGTKQTLQDMYLDPILYLINQNDPSFKYTEDAPLTLMLDFKSNPDSSYYYLMKILQPYTSIITTYQRGKVLQKAPIKICISGRKPWEAMMKDTILYARMDANLMGTKDTSIIEFGDVSVYDTFYPERASAPYANFFNKKLAKPGSFQSKVLNHLVKSYHQRGIEVRFYAAPQDERIWKVLLDAGVDWINVDNLEKFAEFYRDYHLSQKSIE